MTENRERIRSYAAKHPDATVREIMAACRVSSTSVVQHHLKAIGHESKSSADLRRENDELRARVKTLEKIIAKGRDALSDSEGR